MIAVSPSLASAAGDRSPRSGGARRDTAGMASRVTSSTFVGRTTELVELRGALTEAVSGRPSLAFVAGESGVGKTRLLAELERAARADGIRVIGGDCVELGEGELPYAPIVGALRPLARSGHPAFKALSDAARCALAQILPGLGETRHDDEATAQARLFDGLLELLELLAGDDGLMVTIEDLHWADRSTRAFLVYLASTLCNERVLVVTTYRPDELHRRHPLRPLLAELERDARARRVELRPLTRSELAEQLNDILGAAAGRGPAVAAVRPHRGQPAVRRGAARGRHRRARLAPADAARRADAADRAALRATRRRRCACWPPAAGSTTRSSPRRSGIDSRALRDALREAVAAQLVVTDEEARYVFRHALLREVVVDDLLPGRARRDAPRAGARARAARRGPARARRRAPRGRDRASLLASGDQPKALVASVRAAQAAEAVHANGEAAALYSRALQLWDRVANAEELTGCDHVACCVPRPGRRGASTSPPAPSPTCAPRSPSSATPTRCARPSCSSTSRATSSTRAAPPTPPTRAAARSSCCPTGRARSARRCWRARSRS